MKCNMEQIKNILFKIENYNKTINKIKNIFGEDYQELIKYSMSCGVYNETKPQNIYDKIITSLGTYYNGWFEETKLSDKFTFDNKKLIFDFNELQRILLDEYSEDYSCCFKSGILNDKLFLDLVIKVIEKKIVKMHKFSLDVNDCLNNIDNENEVNKLLSTIPKKNRFSSIIKLSKDNTEDIISFQNILYKLFALKNDFEHSKIEIRINNLLEKDKTKLDILISVLKLYIFTQEEIDFINKILHPDIVSNIINSIYNYNIIDIDNNINTKDSKKLVK